jgi:hypothetical protein
MTTTLERRFFAGGELRAAAAGTTPGIAGLAAVYAQQYDTGWFIESIAPGAFTRALAEQQDVRCLFNHDVNNVLARTKNGTLRLTDSTAGLRFEADTDPTTSVGRDVPAMIGRGDVDGCSFSFNVRSSTWRDEYDASGNYVQSYRTIDDVDLFDVGPVTFPAYTATSVDVTGPDPDAEPDPDAARVGRARLWPAGMPADVRRHAKAVETRQAARQAARQGAGGARPAQAGQGSGAGRQGPGARPGAGRGTDNAEPGYCVCDCEQCLAGDCATCSHVDCDCMDCLCDAAQGLRALRLRARAAVAVSA